ncbi:Acidic leucine-rich nuclear phosphoprotein 32 member B [Mycoblastus sanguinarius]|nr:Acidic leucine-rich nuclear phosphoprotein 32 member B [Mycoblastus sanguinarius]
METSPLLRLPRELRDRIYQNLLSTEYAKTPKDAQAGCRSGASRYNWNLDPTILRANRQIHQEAKEILGRDNDFVVIERAAKELEQTERDRREEDVGIMVFNVTIWPGKPSKEVFVPGERMRVWLGKPDQSIGGDFFVVLVEELRDFCVSLSIFGDLEGGYRTAGIRACITFKDSVVEGTLGAKEDREKSLLQPLTKLRFLEQVTIRGFSSEQQSQYEEQMTCGSHDEKLVATTIEELIQSGDQARDIGHFDVATAYYARCTDYFHHFIKTHQHDAFSHPTDALTIDFKLMQHRALNWIEDDDFEQALEAAKTALTMANELFLLDAPQTEGPPTDARGRVNTGAFRRWTCECIREGAERWGQRIKAEDVGRCYYYKSISEHCAFGDDATEQADEDKFTAIGCCVISETMTEEENVPKELMELDIRTMERLSSYPEGSVDEDDGDGEWEDVEEDEDGDEDEDEDEEDEDEDEDGE